MSVGLLPRMLKNFGRLVELIVLNVGLSAGILSTVSSFFCTAYELVADMCVHSACFRCLFLKRSF